MYEDSWLNRNATSLATSSGRPIRRSDTSIFVSLSISSASPLEAARLVIVFNIGVSMRPLQIASAKLFTIRAVGVAHGQIALTRMSATPTSFAADFVRPITPCFDAVYAAFLARP